MDGLDSHAQHLSLTEQVMKTTAAPHSSSYSIKHVIESGQHFECYIDPLCYMTLYALNEYCKIYMTMYSTNIILYTELVDFYGMSECLI